MSVETQSTASVSLTNRPPLNEADQENEMIEVSCACPTKPLIISVLITAAAAVWSSLNFLNWVPASANAVITSVLTLACLSSWFVTGRAIVRYNRAAVASAGAAKEAEQILREQELLRTIIDNLPDCIYAKDTRGRFVLNNTAHIVSFGVNSQEDLKGKSDFDFFPEELAKKFFADEQAIIESGQAILNQEQYKPVKRGDQSSKRWGAASKVIWRDAQGNVLGTVGITRDIHQSKTAQEALAKSEEKLRQFTLQLERSNRELQDFAYVASHDLQEPLRKIVVFGERLKEKCSEALSTDGKDYLERMQKAAARMQVLITDLLSFSRVTTKAQPFVQLNLADVAKDVVSDLEGRIEMVKGRVELGMLPVLEAEPLQMRQLLQNLIGNALKFRRPEEPPVVKVDARIFSGKRPGSAKDAPEEALCELSVSDNGIGFDEKYVDRIFNVFQRLHTRNEYEGTGMGLAIARKIALYHGGDITAKSKVGQGSTFIITLPVVHPKDPTKDPQGNA
jgi:PAS domain S-box-containing protein